MMNDTLVVALVKRRRELLDQLETECPQVGEEQKHLDSGSHEQAYWHHGYQAALADVLETLLGSQGVNNVPSHLN